jgi:hypothetical protein
MSQPLNIVIVEKLGNLKILSIKDFKLEELFKKCGFKKADDFIKQVEWSVKYEGQKYFIEVFAKTEGRANSENKYDFPPPIDTKLFFGSCAVLAHFKKNDGSKIYTNLSLPLWEKIYEKLFGGFENLVTTSAEDDEEEDELANVPKEKKTKQGYLKDGFVVNSSDDEEEDESDSDYGSEIDEDDWNNMMKLSLQKKLSNLEETEETEETENLGSELSEESYEYDSCDYDSCEE